MNFWEFLDKSFNRLPGWPDGRGLVGIATFSLTVGVMVMYRNDPTLRDDDFFKTIATAVVITGFINAIVGWAFGDTAKSKAESDTNGKLADALNQKNRSDNQKADVILEPGETAQASELEEYHAR